MAGVTGATTMAGIGAGAGGEEEEEEERQRKCTQARAAKSERLKRLVHTRQSC